jgi:hypothetical protein
VQVTGIDIDSGLSACIAGITATIYITTYQNLRLQLLNSQQKKYQEQQSDAVRWE